MLEEIMGQIHNRFEVDGASRSGTFTISSGTITLDGVLPGQYFWIDGSVFNDGLHQYPAADLLDETFSGIITPAAIPKAFADLCREIKDWASKHPATDKTSESFGGYSYSRATNAGVGGAPVGWQQVFAPQLSRWRKMY